MYERFSDRARKLMQLANREAQELNHEYIGTEHILLGLLKEGSGLGSVVLRSLGVGFDKIRHDVLELVQRGPEMVTMGKLPQTPCAKKVIEYAIKEADELKHNHIGTEHILLGLMREQEGIGYQVLSNLGVTIEAVRVKLFATLRVDAPETPEATTTNHAWFIQVQNPSVMKAGLATPSGVREHVQRQIEECNQNIAESVQHTQDLQRELAEWESLLAKQPE